MEQRYSNIERELLGVVFGLERLHHYTCGYTVTVQTDHEPLTSIWKKSIASSSPRLQRLLLRLAQYDVVVEFLKGKENIIADALSRICPKTTTESVDLNCISVHMITDTVPASKTRLQELREATQADRTLFLLSHEVYNGWPESEKKCHQEIRQYFSVRADISLEDGLLFKGHRLIIPQSERSETLRVLHLGHYGSEKMTLRARETVYWPGITGDIETTVSWCKTCTENRKSQQKETLQSHYVPVAPWQKLGMDLFELNQVHYLLVVDYYSRFPIVRRLHSLSAAATIKHLKQIFSEHSPPQTVISDNGPQFACKEFQDFAQSWQFQHITSSLRYPQSNGLAERFVQTINSALMKAQQSGEDPDLALLVYRATPISARLPSPAEMLNNRRYLSMLPTKSVIQSNARLESEREEMVLAKDKAKAHHDKTARDLPSLETGTQVHVQLDPEQNRWVPAVVSGTAGVSGRSYQVQADNGGTYVRNRRFLRQTSQRLEQSRTPQAADETTLERPQRTITRPNRLIEDI